MPRPDRAAQGLTTSTLILIALGVLILIGGTVFYLNVTSQGNEQLFACQTQGGTCEIGQCSDRQVEVTIGVCEDANAVCCRGPGN